MNEENSPPVDTLVMNLLSALEALDGFRKQVGELVKENDRLKKENDRLRQERADALNIKTTEGLTASEWVLRAAKAEGLCFKLSKENDQFQKVLQAIDPWALKMLSAGFIRDEEGWSLNGVTVIWPAILADSRQYGWHHSLKGKENVSAYFMSAFRTEKEAAIAILNELEEKEAENG